MSLFKRRPLALILISFILSSLLTAILYTHASGGLRLLAFAPLLLVASPFIALWKIRKRKHLPLALALLLALLIAPLCQILYHGAVVGSFSTIDAGRVHTLCATVEAEEGLTKQQAVYTVEAESIDGEPTGITLRLYVDKNEPPLKIGDRILCIATVRERENAYLYGRGIGGSMTADGAITIEESNGAQVTVFRRWQVGLSSRIQSAVGGDGGALFSAVLLGGRADLPADVRTDFRRTGLSHVLALSGLHLSVLAVFLLKLLRKLPIPRAVSFAVFTLFLLLYAAIAGFPLSLLRAAGMLTLSELGRLIRLRADPITSLLLSVTLIIAVSPSAITDLGLWLSFLATLGILAAEGLALPLPRRRPLRMLLGVGRTLLSTCLALCFTTLLTAVTFGGASLITLPANLLIAPLIHAMLLIGPFLLLFPTVLGWAAEILSGLTLSLVRFFSDLRGIYLPTNRAFLFAAVLMSGVIVVLLLIPLKKQKIYYFSAVGTLALSFAVLLTGHAVTAQTDTVYYISQSSSEYLIIRSEAKTALIAKGGSADTLARLEKALQAEEIGDIDTLILLAGGDTGDEFLSALAEEVHIHNLYVSTESAVSDPNLSEAAAALRLTPLLLPQRTLLSGDIECSFLGGIAVRGEEEEGFLLKLYVGDTEIGLTSAAALADAKQPACEAFLQNTDLLLALDIHGTHPLTGVDFPQDVTVILTQPSKIPDQLIKNHRVLISPQSYVFPME